MGRRRRPFGALEVSASGGSGGLLMAQMDHDGMVTGEDVTQALRDLHLALAHCALVYCIHCCRYEIVFNA